MKTKRLNTMKGHKKKATSAKVRPMPRTSKTTVDLLDNHTLNALRSLLSHDDDVLGDLVGVNKESLNALRAAVGLPASKGCVCLAGIMFNIEERWPTVYACEKCERLKDGDVVGIVHKLLELLDPEIDTGPSEPGENTVADALERLADKVQFATTAQADE